MTPKLCIFLGFILKICFYRIRAKLVNQGGGGGLLLLFPHQDVQKYSENEKKILSLKIAEIGMGSILGQKKDSRSEIYLNRLMRTLILPSRPLTPGMANIWKAKPDKG